MDDLWNKYLLYLLWKCNLDNGLKYGKYSRLFEILHHIEFTWSIPRDDNREADGLELREEYDIPHGYTIEEEEDFQEHWVSVLEMLIGLAVRVEDEIIGDPADEHPEDFFMDMIKNLGLDIFVGKRFLDEDVIKIVRRWLNRRFEPDGRWSPFPVRNDCRDQRELEIWDQMNSYISENYI